MKKFKTLALILAVVMASMLVLNACSSGTNTQPSASPTASDAASASPVDDTVYTFKIDYPNSENSAIYPLLVEWAAHIKEQSGGRLIADIYPNGQLGPLPECVNNCVGGLTDGFWSGVTIYAGVFPGTEVFGLPMLGAESQEVVTAAMNEMLNDTEFLTGEWSNLKVIALHSATASPLLFKAGKEIKSAADLAGLDLRLSNAYTTEWEKLLGANPVTCPINDGYEYMEKGIIDGGLFFFDQIQSSALYEQIDYLLLAETIYPLTMFCMNKDRYEALPDDLKAIIDESGAWFISKAPEIYNAQKDAMIAKCEESGVTVAEPSDAFVAEMTEAAKPAWDMWIKTVTDKGLDGQAIFDKATALIEKYNAEFGK